MNEVVINILKYAFFMIGVLLLIMGVLSNRASNLHLGIVLTYITGVLALVVGAVFNYIVLIVHWLVLAIIGMIFFAIIVFIAVLYIVGATPTAKGDEDAVIVLGAGIKGREIGANLKSRLDKVYEYHKQNPKALIFLSGGKGASEEISEAEAMANYLLEKGVDKGLMILEDKSTTTQENFIYTKALFENAFNGEYNALYVTNDFHVYRSSKYAKRAGFENLRHLGSPTVWYMVAPNGIREFLAVIELWILK